MFLKNLSAGEILASYPLALAHGGRIFWRLHRVRCWCTGGTVQYPLAETHPVLTSERWTFSGLLCYCKGEVMRVTIKGVCNQQRSTAVQKDVRGQCFQLGKRWVFWRWYLAMYTKLASNLGFCCLSSPTTRIYSCALLCLAWTRITVIHVYSNP